MVSALEVKHDGGVACVTLNRPDKRNAVDDAMRDALAATFAGLDDDSAIRVAILTGAGPAFCAGADLTAHGNVTARSTHIATPVVTRPRLSAPLESFSKPIIAALNGVAVGGGLELALACDIRIAAAGARFGLPEVKIGSIPGSGGTQRLAGTVGRSFAAHMLFTGDPITAEQAMATGLVSEVLAPDALMERAWALAKAIASNAPLSLVAIKKAFRAATDQPLTAGFELERALYGALTLSEDRAEGRAAFREKRKADFKGR